MDSNAFETLTKILSIKIVNYVRAILMLHITQHAVYYKTTSKILNYFTLTHMSCFAKTRWLIILSRF